MFRIWKIAILCAFVFATTVVTPYAEGRILRVTEDYPTIAAAVSAAASGDTILLAPQRYQEHVDLDSVRVTIAGNYILSGDSTDISATVLTIPDSIRTDSTRSRSAIQISRHSTVRIVGLTLRDCNGTLASNHRWTRTFIGGGAIYAVNSTVSVHRCRITNNTARLGGGGLFFDSNVEILDCRVDSCTGYSANWAGGGLSLFCDSASIENTLFYRNKHIQGLGGGLAMDVTHSGSLSSCVFLENIACLSSGAGYLYNLHDIKNNVVESNQSSSDGAFYIAGRDSSAGNFHRLIDNRFINNRTADTYGMPASYSGCLYFDNDSGVNWLIADNVFQGNAAGTQQAMIDGGCLHFQRGNFTIKRNRFTGNMARYGSVCMARLESQVLLDSNIITQNFGIRTIYFYQLASGAVTNNDFIRNTGFAVFNEDSNATAIGNFYGDSTGPQAPDNPNGRGDDLPTGVVYRPFRTTPVFQQNAVGEGGSRPGDPFAVKQYALLRTYPNPANSSVTISYSLPRSEKSTRIELFDPLGRRVSILYDGFLAAGEHRFQWHPEKTSSGTYFVRASTPTITPSTTAIQLVK